MSAALQAIAGRAAADGLAPLGAFHPAPEDAAPPGTGTLVLLGPAGPEFWEGFRASPEAGDGGADPLDRWSARVIGEMAEGLGATAVFPFGGPPWAPFTAWARRSGEAWTSPVGLLVHARLGLFVSYRGALAFRDRLELAPAGLCPCEGCARPCLTACPVGRARRRRLRRGGLPRLPRHRARAAIASTAAARCAAPARSGAGLRPEAQSAFHMADFHGKRSGCDA